MEEIRKLVYAVFILVLIVLGHGDAEVIQTRCRETEREALLAFKQGLVDDSNHLSSWGSHDPEKQDCCAWEGVHCSNRTAHVIKLDLGGVAQYDLKGQSDLKGTMFSPKLIELQHLRYLSLSQINFTGSHIPDSIASLTNLRHLDLSETYLGGRFPSQVGNLTRLEYLDLSMTNFGGRFPSQVGNLTRLEYLDLRYNDYTNVENLNWLRPLSSLTYLDLSSSNLSNVIDWLEAINQLPKLRNLTLADCGLRSPPRLSTLLNSNASKSLAKVDLPGNQLSSSVFLWLSNFNTSLVHLGLWSNHLTGSIPDVFGNMSSLVNLYLQHNQLEGAEPHSFSRLCSLQGLNLVGNNLSGPFSKFVRVLSTCAQNSLQQLSLDDNQLEGSIPNLTNFSALKTLSVGYNHLTGWEPESIGQLSKLGYVDFGTNSLEGVISETHFSKLPNLRYLDLSFNSLVLNFSSNWVPPFQLDSIYLSSCKNIDPYFPQWLQTQKGFSWLDISNAGISDIFPSWFWGLCHNLRFMNISHNQIRGNLANVSAFEFAYYPELHLSSNLLEGPIPSLLSKVSVLDISNNMIFGSMSVLCDASVNVSGSLAYLDLSRNNVFGELPDCFTHLESLFMLDLSNNSLSGKVPTSIGSLHQIETLKLRSNRFEGELPSSLKNCTRLKVIDIGDNRFSGPIPKWLGVSFPNLVILMLSSNHFTGNMPSQFCHLVQVQILDLSVNNISGSIPKCINNLTALTQKGNSSLAISHALRTNWTYVNYEDEATFVWKGVMSSYKNTLGLVKRIDLSSNRLSGEIPTDITHLAGLIALNLSRNQLTGQIPLEIGKLQSLDSLDLSRNQIHGKIPPSLARVSSLGSLDVSYNNLSGKIPIGTQLQSFDSSVYAGNSQLCGLPLQKCESDEKGPEQTFIGNHEGKDDFISRGFYISMAVGFVVGFWGVCSSLIFVRPWRYAYFKFLNVLNDWFYVRIALIKRRYGCSDNER